MNLDSKIFYTFLPILVIGLAGIIYWHITYEMPKLRERIAACEAAGGVYLKNTEIIGKITNVSYACVDKNAIIEVK